MTSNAFSVHTVNSCIQKAEEFCGSPFVPQTEIQQAYYDNWYKDQLNELKLFTEIESRADTNIPNINAWLKERGFDIQLVPIPPPSFGVASIMEIVTQWFIEGTPYTVYNPAFPSTSFKGFMLNYDNLGSYVGNFWLESLVDFPNNPLINIKTKNGDVVHLLEATGEPLDPLALITHVAKAKKTSYNNFVRKLVVPEICLNKEIDISWMEGGKFPPEFTIAQALKQVIFKMNQKGVEVKVAVAFGVSGSMCFVSDTYTVDKPFYCWITRKGCNVPYFAAYLDTDCWVSQ